MCILNAFSHNVFNRGKSDDGVDDDDGVDSGEDEYGVDSGRADDGIGGEDSPPNRRGNKRPRHFRVSHITTQ